MAAIHDPTRHTPNLNTPLPYERIVVIKSISQKEMDQFLPHRFNIDRFIGSEAEWFSDEVGNIIGTIAEGTTNMHWGYAVLRRDDGGKYQFCGTDPDCSCHESNPEERPGLFPCGGLRLRREDLCESKTY
jgi:hypothetical protein